MTKQSMLLGGVAVVAGIAAIYLWVELRHEREASAEEQRVEQPAPSASPPAVVQQGVPPSPVETPAALPPPAAPPGLYPIAYTPEFDRIFRNQRPDRDYSLIGRMHLDMQQESRDPEWAPVMEDEWRTMLAGKQDLMRYGIPTIECRSTMCEIRIVAHGVSEEELAKAVKQPGTSPSARFSQLNTVITAADSQNGTTAHVTVVKHTRVPPAKTGP